MSAVMKLYTIIQKFKQKHEEIETRFLFMHYYEMTFIVKMHQGD